MRKPPSVRSLLVPSDTIALKQRMGKDRETLDKLRDPELRAMLEKERGADMPREMESFLSRRYAASADTLQSEREQAGYKAGWTKTPQGTWTKRDSVQAPDGTWRKGTRTISGVIPGSAEFMDMEREEEEMRKRSRPRGMR